MTKIDVSERKMQMENLKNNLPRGYRQEIAAKLSLSIHTVDKVISGDRFNREILEMAITMAKNYKEDLLWLRENLQQL